MNYNDISYKALLSILFISVVLLGIMLSIDVLTQPTTPTIPIIYTNETTHIYNCSYNKTIVQQYITNQPATTQVIKPQNELQEIARDVANDYIYEANIFDCTQFCRETKLRLEQHGYRGLSVWTVKLDCNNLKMQGYAMDYESCKQFYGKHDILKLGDFGYLECTNGFIISPKDYEKYNIE